MKLRHVFVTMVVVVMLGILLVPLVARDVVPPWTAAVYALLFVVMLIGLPICLFFQSCLNASTTTETPDQVAQELGKRGLLDSATFHANRAFQVEEFEDEGSSYFLELGDGSVLFMTGQYLYDYEPVEEEDDLHQPRRFPCTEFIVHRHKTEGYVVEIVCGGNVLEPEAVTPPFGKKDFKDGLVYEDGQVIADLRYDDIKDKRLRSRDPAHGSHG